MKQTAVDWLINQIELEAKLAFLDNRLPQWLIEKAKQMEKEQIEEAFKSGAFYDGYELQSKQYYWEEYENKL